MVSQKVIVKGSEGLHIRPADILIRHLEQFDSEVLIFKDGQEYNGRSIVSLLSAVIKQGDEIEIRVSGPDEKEALLSIVDMIESGLEE